MDFCKLNPIIAKYRDVKGSLITILQEVQGVYGHLPVELLEEIAKRMNIKPARVHGVATFYTQFRSEPVGKHHIMLCQGTACHVSGSGALFETLSLELGVGDGGTTKDGIFTLSNVACLGCCSLAPAMMIGDKTYGNLTNDKAIEIIRELKDKP